MVGECGTIKTGVIHHYYKCASAKRRKGYDKKAVKKEWIENFVNSIYLYDDKIVFTFNYKDGTKTVSLAELEEELSSDLEGATPPNKNAVLYARRFYLAKITPCGKNY